MLPDSHWHELGEPATPAEAAALRKVREILPDDGITTAWANVTFIDHNGRTAEVDVLLLTKRGFFVVELKGWHGTIRGSSQWWTVTNRSTRQAENPLLLTDRKAKRLSTLLKDYAPNGKAKASLPFIGALVVLHGEGSHVELDDARARTGILTLDGYDVHSPKSQRIGTLKSFVAQEPNDARDFIDHHRATLVRAACQRANLKPTPKQRSVGHFVVADTELIAEGPTWQDFVVDHPATKVRRRLRIYDLPPGVSADERLRIEQEAEREFRLTQGIVNEGITVPLDMITTDSGPALVFAYDESEVPLEAYLDENSTHLTLEDRVALVRQLGERLRFAHQRRLVHRALAPRHVWIRPGDVPQLTIRDWYAGQKDRASTRGQLTTISAGVSDIGQAVGTDDWLYLAPEALHGSADLPSIPLDVYGFGAVAFRILTGRPPAANLAELQRILQERGYLDAGASSGLPDDVVTALQFATAVAEPERAQSVEDVLGLVEEAWARARKGEDDAPADPTPATDPLEAQQGDLVGERFLVQERRGEGSTGTAFVVVDMESESERGIILKVARTDAAGPRLVAEAETLRVLDHPRVVRLIGEGVVEVDGRTALLMSDAGKETLAARIATEGRATLTQLEQYGSDLVEAVRYLDQQGVFHRDIKPANLGIAPDPSSKIPRLTLFDLSLSREPIENIGSGTLGYLDPYLGGKRRRFDRAAELWSVVATLFEMATGEMPWWQSGGSGPANATDAPVVAPEGFEQVVAPALTEFFTKALAPATADRFGGIDELAMAWHAVFDGLSDGAATATGDDGAAASARRDTLLEQAGLSARALSGLARLDVHTVGDLLAVPAFKINKIRGLGEKYRKEIQGRVREWRDRLGAAPESTEPAVARRSVEGIVEALLDDVPAADAPAVRTLLGVGSLGTMPWPTSGEVAKATGITRERVVQATDRAVGRWSGRRDLEGLTDEVLTVLAREGRVLTVPHLASLLAAERGSTKSGDERAALGAALVRAVIEVETQLEDPRIAVRRRSAATPLVALTEGADPDATDDSFPPADDLFDLAVALGAAADQLVQGGRVLPAGEAAERFRAIGTEATGEAMERWGQDALLRLATGTSTDAALSGLGEVYSRDLPVATALTVALRGRPGRSISEDWIRRRVSSRFPALRAAVPARPRLDELVREVFGNLVWQPPATAGATGVYAPADSLTRAATSLRSTTVQAVTGSTADTHLRESLRRRSALTLCVPPSRHGATVAALVARYGVRPVDVAAFVLDAARDLAQQRRITWAVALRADGDRTGPGWGHLTRLVRDALTRDEAPRWTELMASPEPLLLFNAGLLVRYRMAGLLSELLDVATPRPAARWLLVPRDGSRAVPLLDGQPVPLGPDRWLDLPHHVELLGRPAEPTGASAAPDAGARL
jgi:serine/threonine protein kinase